MTNVSKPEPNETHTPPFIQKAWVFGLIVYLWISGVILYIWLYIAYLPRRWHEYGWLFTGGWQTSLASINLTPHLAASYLLGMEIASVLASISMAVIIFWRNSTNQAGLLTSFTLVAFCISCGTTALMKDASMSHPWRIWLDIASSVGFSMALFVICIVPDGRFAPRWTKLLVIFWVGWMLLGLFYPPVSFFALRGDGIPFKPNRFVLFLAAQALVFGLGILAQIYRYRFVSTGHQRQQTKLILVGVVLVLGGYLMDEVLPIFFPIINHPGMPGLLYQLLGVPLLYNIPRLLLPFFIALAILRYQLLDIDLLINRSLVYGALTISIGVLYFASVGVLQLIFRTTTGQFSEAAAVLSTILIVIIFQPLRRSFQNGIDRRFYREKINFRQAFQVFTREVRHYIDLPELLHVIVYRLTELFHCGYGALYLYEFGKFRLAESRHLPAAVKGLFPRESQLEKLQVGEIIVNQYEYFSLLIPLISFWADRREFVGVLALGPRLSEVEYGREELSQLEMLVDEAGTAISLAQTFAEKRKAEQQREAAEQANRAKSAFLANMSHELRTPLNAILGFSQIMTRDATLNSVHRESIEIINRNGEHLLGLINNVLDMAKIESGHISLQERPFDLSKLIESVGSMFRMRANSKGLSLTVECDPDVPNYLQLDDAKLRQVLINLLGNAIKFTTTGGIVLRVCTCDTADHLHFEVEDTGPGISPAEMDSLFEPFSQTSSGRQAGEGTGLGLPISRQFVHLMGGELTLESRPGKGSLFSFDVLIHRPEDTQPLQALELKPHVIGLAAGQPAYRLLIVEDQIDSRLLLVGLLSAVGLQLQTASNGQEAIAIWQDWQPHLILMDLRLPVMSGHEAIQKIRALPGGQETIIIAVSASSFTEEREQMLNEGCHDFIRKPYREEEIFEVLARHLKLRFIYENETSHQGQSVPLDFSDMPFTWLSQLQKAALEADAEKIQELAQEISQTHPALAEETIRLCNHFAYEAILAAIFPAKGLI